MARMYLRLTAATLGLLQNLRIGEKLMMTDDPVKLAAVRCVVAYLKATRNQGLPVKRRIAALQDTVFVAELLDKECVNAYELANASSVLEKKLRGVELRE